MEKNCKFCRNRKYVIETVWNETQTDNIVVRIPQHIRRVSCSCDPKLYDMFTKVNEGRITEGISLPCFTEMPSESWFDELVQSVNSLLDGE